MGRSFLPAWTKRVASKPVKVRKRSTPPRCNIVDTVEKCLNFNNLKELITAKGHKEAEAHGGEVEDALGHHEADGEEQVGGRDEGEDQEAKAEEDKDGRNDLTK